VHRAWKILIFSLNLLRQTKIDLEMKVLKRFLWFFLLPLIVIISAILFMFFPLSCKKEDPILNQIPELTDPIPFDKLGAGTIAFKRIGPLGEYAGCYVVDVEQRKTWSLSFPLAGAYSISPEGKKIAFTKYTNSITVYDIYLVNVQGTSLKQLSSTIGQDKFPSWSPDGNRVFYWVEGQTHALFSQSPNPARPDLTMILILSSYPPNPYYIDISGAVSVSPAGKIAFVCMAADLPSGIYTLNEDGSGLNLIVPYPQVDPDQPATWHLESPVFSPDGQKIAFFRLRKGPEWFYEALELMMVDNQGGTPELIASLPVNGRDIWADNGKKNSVYLAWSPDGSKFLFNIPKGDYESHIYLLDADGSNLTQVTFTEGVTDRCISWGR